MLRGMARRPGALVALVGGAAGGLVALALTLGAKDPVSRCPGPQHDAIGPPLNLVFVVLCTASFLAGGLLSDFARGRDDIEDAKQSTRGQNWLQGALVGVLLILFLLLSYETYALVLLDSNERSVFWPITWFVRCLSAITTLATTGSLVVVCIMCAFFGKWLWYRPRKYQQKARTP
jgi:hypothetical protein